MRRLTTQTAVALTMKIIQYLIICLLISAGVGSAPGFPAADGEADPRISLTAKNEPLGDVLDAITADTGYQFKLNSQWESWPVSATIGNLPLEQGLKRLLRSLNYTIIWEADRTISIMVYGKADPVSSGGSVSYAAPPQSIPEELPPEVEPDEDAGNAEPEAETAPDAEAGENEAPDEAPSDAGDETQQVRVRRPPAAVPSSGADASPGEENPPD